MVEVVGGKEKIARCDPLAKRKSSDEASDSCYNVQLSEGSDCWLDSTVGGLPHSDDVASLLNAVICRKGCRCSSSILLENVVPNANLKSALGRVGYTSPVHVTVRLGHDRCDQAEILACTGYAIDRESASFADQGVGVDQADELVDLLSGQVVREKHWCKTIESAGCVVSGMHPIMRTARHSPKRVTRYSMLFGK